MNKDKGDILRLAKNGDYDVIVHGCNCFGIFGAGIAKQIRMQYPHAYAADLKTTRGDYAKVGTYSQYKTEDGFVIINAYTQYGFNKKGEVDDLFEYEGFYKILKQIKSEFGGVRYGFPYIGMGLAGGNKEKIIELINDFSYDIEDLGGSVTLVEFS